MWLYTAILADGIDYLTTIVQAIFGREFENGLVTIVRRLMATDLLAGTDLGQSTSVDT